MNSFKDSQEAAYRRLMRDAVRKGGFSKSERDVTLAILNMWFHHRNGPKGFIHPSRKMIAKKADVSVKTVSRTLAMLRGFGALVPVSGTRGGKSHATQYKVDDLGLYQLCGGDMQKIIAAMTPAKRDKCPGINGAQSGTKCPTVYSNVQGAESLAKNANVIGFPDRREVS